MKLSDRSAWPGEPSPWAQAVARARKAGSIRWDLSSSNPTTVGLLHPPSVLAALGDPGSARYDPRARGLASARAAVVEHYARRDVAIDARRVGLYASTSEAYAQWLAIVADPGDAVLVPRPGYPLLDMLGDLSGVRRVPYPLVYEGGWHLDVAGLERALATESRARAIVVVAPSNPTGWLPSEPEWEALQRCARAHEVMLIVDEVFADYPLDPRPGRRARVVEASVPCVVLGGLSKAAALPQLKLSWAVMHGPAEAIAEPWRRAELAADALLGVATPVQRALPQLLEAAEAIQPRIRERLHANLEVLRTALRDRPVDRLATDAGWTALLRLPALDGLDDLGWAHALLDAGVLVQPGFLFDLPEPPRVAVSLLTPPQTLAVGVHAIVERVETTLSGDPTAHADPGASALS